jgi:hypothetical protein
MMITTPLLSRRRTTSSSSSLSSLGDWFAQEFRYLCSRQAEDELDDDAKTSLAQEFSSNSEALLLASHKASLSSSSSPEWNSDQDVRQTTTQYHRSESSSSPPRSINLFSSSFQKTSRGQETDETTTTTTTTTAATKTTRSLKKKAQESAAGIIVTAAAPANYKNNKKNLKPQEQVSSSPSSLSPGNVVVLLRKYGDRKDLRRIAATGSLQQSPDLQQQQREQGWKTGSQIQNRRRSRRSGTTDCNAAASKMHQTSEWTPSTQQAIASFQEEVTKMLLESRGEDEDDVHDLEAIEDFVNGYMQLNTPFYLEMVEEFFRAVCLNCFHKPLLPSYWRLQASC